MVLNDALRAAGLFSVQSETTEGRITLSTRRSGAAEATFRSASARSWRWRARSCARASCSSSMKVSVFHGAVLMTMTVPLATSAIGQCQTHRMWLHPAELTDVTSDVDYATDTVIQKALREDLGKDVTLLTIAHRLQTVMDADRIVCCTVLTLPQLADECSHRWCLMPVAL